MGGVEECGECACIRLPELLPQETGLSLVQDYSAVQFSSVFCSVVQSCVKGSTIQCRIAQAFAQDP